MYVSYEDRINSLERLFSQEKGKKRVLLNFIDADYNIIDMNYKNSFHAVDHIRTGRDYLKNYILSVDEFIAFFCSKLDCLSKCNRDKGLQLINPLIEYMEKSNSDFISLLKDMDYYIKDEIKYFKKVNNYHKKHHEIKNFILIEDEGKFNDRKDDICKLHREFEDVDSYGDTRDDLRIKIVEDHNNLSKEVVKIKGYLKIVEQDELYISIITKHKEEIASEKQSATTASVEEKEGDCQTTSPMPSKEPKSLVNGELTDKLESLSVNNTQENAVVSVNSNK